MISHEYPVKSFAQSNPKGPGQDSVPDLLRRVADTLDAKAGGNELDVLDLILHNEIDERGRDWPSISVYFDRTAPDSAAGDPPMPVRTEDLSDYERYDPRGPWFAVRSVVALAQDSPKSAVSYEERVVLLVAPDIDAAIARAEREAAEYADSVGGRALDLFQAYQVVVPIDLTAPVAVFSLIRDSRLSSHEYVDRMFDTGTEHQAV